MCTVPLPPGGNPIAVKYILSYHIIISYHHINYHIIYHHIISYIISFYICRIILYFIYHIIYIVSCQVSYHFIYHISYNFIYHHIYCIISYFISYHVSYHFIYHIIYILSYISYDIYYIISIALYKTDFVICQQFKIERTDQHYSEISAFEFYWSVTSRYTEYKRVRRVATLLDSAPLFSFWT
jgi:hypothetical protein